MRHRGKKGIRAILEQQPGLVVLQPHELKGKWASFFGNLRPIHVELGMGKGQFISQMSVLNREVNFIGADRYDELVRMTSVKAREVWDEAEHTEPANLALALLNIEHIEDVFADGEIDRIYLNFSDPWPKKRHARRRLTAPSFLQKYRKLLTAKGEIHFKTDSQSLFEFSLNSFAGMGLQMKNISLDLHREGINPEHVMTEYETKFVQQGKNIYRCEVIS